MHDSLYLDPDAWDLTLDAFGNIASVAAPYSIAQDVACACRLWRGEARYDTTRGIPYDTDILGQRPSPPLLSAWYETEAMTVPDVAIAAVLLQYSNINRTLSGQIQLTLSDGSTSVLSA